VCKARRDLQWAVAFVVTLCSLGAKAATLQVGTCRHFPMFATIQAAVTAAGPGSTRLVCPGTYPEQVTINRLAALGHSQERGRTAA
jgi:hypothetical protein